MEILQIYERAKEELEKSLEVSLQNGITISSITLILSDNDTCYSGVNWSRINDSFLIEQTCSEYEALTNLLFDGNNSVKAIVTLDATTKLPINPCVECQKLIVKINPENISCSVITGDDSVAVLSELNPDLTTLVSDSPKEDAVADIIPDAEEAKEPESVTVPTDETPDNNTDNTVSEDETKVSPSSIDTSELKMIFDDWESTDETPNDVAETIKNKPFNVNSLSLSPAQSNQEKAAEDNKQHAVFTQSAPPQNNNMYQQAQPVNNAMYQQQPMNGMYQQQQPMNGMYQQQPMNGMYQQQPMNGMYQQQQPMNGMYQQQQPMNGMYQQQQPMNAMYQQQQQPMNGMYHQQQQPMNGMYQQQQQPMNAMYQQQQQTAAPHVNSIYMAPQQPQNNFANQGSPAPVPTPAAAIPQPNTFAQSPINTIRPTTQSSTSVYGTNINSSDNNAIFKDKLNNLLSAHSTVSDAEDEINDVLQSAKDKKKAEKLKAKLKKQKKNDEL